MNFIELSDVQRKHDLFGFSVSDEHTVYREVESGRRAVPSLV